MSCLCECYNKNQIDVTISKPLRNCHNTKIIPGSNPVKNSTTKGKILKKTPQTWAFGWTSVDPSPPDLEKAASGASGACGHFVENHAILRTFWFEIPAFLTEDGGRSVKDGKLRIDQGELRLYDGELRIENSEMRLKSCGLRQDNQNLRILSCYPHI